MKKVFYFAAALLVALSFASCKTDKTQNNEEQTAVETAVEEVAETATSTIAELSEEAKAKFAELGEGFFGTYVATLPAADAPGLETTLTVNSDFTYTWAQKVVEGEELPVVEGKVTDLNQDLVITLTSNEGETSQFKLIDGKLVMLNADGTEPTGEFLNAQTFTRK